MKLELYWLNSFVNNHNIKASTAPIPAKNVIKKKPTNIKGIEIIVIIASVTNKVLKAETITKV